MSTRLHRDLKDIENSFKIMKMGLHAWDGVDDQIDDKLEEIEKALAQSSIDPKTVESFRLDRERLWALTSQERNDNIDNMEKVLTGLKVTAVAGLAIPTAVAAYYAAPALLLATGGKSFLAGGLLAVGGFLVNGTVGPLAGAAGQGLTGSWSASDWHEMMKLHCEWGAVAGGAGALAYSVLPALRVIPWGTHLRHPLQAGLKLGKWAASKWEWVTEKWYRRWAPVPLGIGYGLARNYLVAKKQERERAQLSRPVPAAIRQTLKDASPPWGQGLPLAQHYIYDKELMEYLFPALYRQTVTPEAALVLTHMLLDILSLHPALDFKTKIEYLEIMDREYQHVMENFGSKVLTLGLTGAADSKEGIFEFGEEGKKQYIRGYIVKEGIQSLIDEMKQEKRELLKGMAVHEAWLRRSLRVDDEESHKQRLKVFDSRKDYVEREYAIHWGKVQSKLNDMDVYLGKIKQSYEAMKEDFMGKNLDIWMLYLAQAAPGNVLRNPSSGQLLGWLGGSFFVQGSGPFAFIKAIPFGAAAGFVSASYTAEDLATSRQPISLCLPSYGSLCERL